MIYTSTIREKLAKLHPEKALVLLVLSTFPDGAGIVPLSGLMGNPPILTRVQLQELEDGGFIEREGDWYKSLLIFEDPEVGAAKGLLRLGLLPSEVERLLSFGIERVNEQLSWLPYRKGIVHEGLFIKAAIERNFGPPRELPE